MNAPLRGQFPAHVEGLLRFLSKPQEKANEDLALGYFRKLFPEFVRQVEATGADGYVPGRFVLELKGHTGDWFAGLLQGVAYKRDLDFSTIVVAAKQFLAVWRLEDLPEKLRRDILSAPGAASTLGKKFARKHSDLKNSIYRKAIWRGDEMFMELFAAQRDVLLGELRHFEQTLRAAERLRQSITPRNFTSVLKKMVQYFDPDHPLKAVGAFYSMVYGWDEHSVLQLSHRSPTQAALGGETIKDIDPGKRLLFKEFVESHAIRLAAHENRDDFFSRYDEALDAVDREFRIKHGIFFTDLDLSKLALWLVRQHIPGLGKNYLVVDPACGSGNLVTNWRSPLELRHKVVSEIEPNLLYVVEKRMKGDQWHNGRFTVIPKVEENRGLNFLDKSASDYLGELTRHLEEKGHSADKPLAFLCNPPYRSDDDQAAERADYHIHSSIIEQIGKDASAERYCCFLAQMSLICKEAKESGLPGPSVLLVFSKAAWLTERTMFRDVRRLLLGRFEDCAGFLVNSKQFFDVKGRFPVAFTIWRYVGENSTLNQDRPIPLTDLTSLTKQELATLPWEEPSAVDAHCNALFESATKIQLGLQRQPIKTWVGQNMTDFKRSRRKAERGTVAAGGLPKGDARLENKKVYGDVLGTGIGFMDDLTPCRTNKSVGAVPYFHLDPRFMRVRDARCLSGHSDHYSYAADSVDKCRKLFFWYALSRTFAERGYPIWADASELWAPRTEADLDDTTFAYALAIAFAENECVETVFPANNPISGAAEVSCSNPFSPVGSSSSFWTQNLARLARATARQSINELVDAVERIYRSWSRRFREQAELHVPYRRSYFLGRGVLRNTSGLIQIKDYATETHDEELLALLQSMRDKLKTVKKEFYDHLLGKDGLNYLGAPSRRALPRQERPAKPTFDEVLERRLTLAGATVDKLQNDAHLGRTKLAKVFYLADMTQALDLATNYYRQAAGPLDPRAFYDRKIGIEALAAQRGYFTATETRRSVKYSPSERLRPLVKNAPVLFGSKWAGIKKIIELCEPLTTDQCEIVATLYACWNDLLLDRKTATDEVILREFLTKWHDKKRRFPKQRLVKALGWMRKNGLVARGGGKHTFAKRTEPTTLF